MTTTTSTYFYAVPHLSDNIRYFQKAHLPEVHDTFANSRRRDIAGKINDPVFGNLV